MYISRTLSFLSIILAFTYAGIPFKDTIFFIFGPTPTTFEAAIREQVAEYKWIYKHHPKVATGLSLLMTGGVGLEERGVIEAITTLLNEEGIEALANSAIGLAEGAVNSIKKSAIGIVTTLEEIKSLPLKEIAAGAFDVATELDYKQRTKQLVRDLLQYTRDTILEKYPLTGAQLLLLVARPLAKSDNSTINTPEIACEAFGLVYEKMQRAVDERIEQFEPPEDFVHKATFYENVREAMRLKFNSNGYNNKKDLGCYESSNYPLVCFKDRFKSGEKTICTSYASCYEEYTALVRHQTEQLFPIESFEQTCHKSLQELIDGKFVILHILFTILPRKNTDYCFYVM